MSTGRKFDYAEIKHSPIPTGALSRMSSSRQPGRSSARLFEISLKIMLRVTMPQITGRWRQMSDESFPEQVQRLVVDNAFAFVLGWLLGAGHVLSLFSDLAGAFS